MYGRNDSHGYNLHKRAALSLNNIAALLTRENDEILFVDWNSPPGLPTFIEAIHDLLTDKAKELIKIIVVDFHIHKELYSLKTDKHTIEPIARNVAIRRSNSKNKWILSTNTDMIFITKDSSKSLSDICANLSDGFYELPRFSIPEIIWETFNRLDPIGVIEELKVLRTKIDLDEIISAGPIIRYDAPGDFQLCLREQLFYIRGFDEDMDKGWHVDSNLCRRLNLLNGETRSLDKEILGYHCEHTKITTHFTSTQIQNSLIDYFERVSNPFSSNTNLDWGLSFMRLREDNVKQLMQQRFKLLLELAQPPSNNRDPVYANSMGDLISYPISHALPYLVDSIYGYPKETKIIYFGADSSRYNLFKSLFGKIEFNNFYFYSDNYHLSDFFSKNITDPMVIVLDMGFPIGELNVSTTTHGEMNNDFKKVATILLENFLTFFKTNYKDKRIYSTPVITLNVETYDSGMGVFLKKWLYLPQVASNSRVRVAHFKKVLINREALTLQKLIEKTLNQINYLGNEYFNRIPINTRMIDKQGIQLRSHQVWPYSTSSTGVKVNRRGLMLRRSGYINLDFSKIEFQTEMIVLIEIDRPRIDGNVYDVSVDVCLNKNFSKLLFTKDSSETMVVQAVSNQDFKKINFEFNSMNYDVDHDAILRLTNMGVFKRSSLNQSIVLKRSSDLSSRYFLRENWSFSNENLRRWTSNSTFSINANRFDTSKMKCVALEVNYYKNMDTHNFIKNIHSKPLSTHYKFIEIPRIKKSRGRIIFIFLPKNVNGDVYIESLAEAFMPFEINSIESRKVYSKIGAFGITEGVFKNACMILLFPLFIIWIKVKKLMYETLRKIENFGRSFFGRKYFKR
jgi:hypothetical protein